MRYFIKAYPMHEHEVEALKKEAENGGVDANVSDGVVVGMAEEDAIKRLAAQGIVLQTLGAVREQDGDTQTGGDPVETHAAEGPANRYAYAGNDPINGSDPTGHGDAGDIVYHVVLGGMAMVNDPDGGPSQRL